jgi:hypothetical protein
LQPKSKENNMAMHDVGGGGDKAVQNGALYTK